LIPGHHTGYSIPVYIIAVGYERLLCLRMTQAPLFAGLPGDVRDRILESVSVRRHESGTVLASAGSMSPAMFMILSGTVDVKLIDAEGNETLLRRLSAPTMFGYCLLSGKPFSADVVASGTVVCAHFGLDRTREILSSQPDALFTAIGHLSSLVESLSEERMGLKTRTLSERIISALESAADSEGVCSISHEELGRMAGGSRANVSRALKKLEGENLLVLERRRIRLRP
jgi:CRP-like cAMP-binding protein